MRDDIGKQREIILTFSCQVFSKLCGGKSTQSSLPTGGLEIHQTFSLWSFRIYKKNGLENLKTDLILQGGPLLVINGVITLINGLINAYR